VRLVIEERGPHQFDLTSSVEQVQQIEVGERLNVLEAGSVLLEDLHCAPCLRGIDGLDWTRVFRHVWGVDDANGTKLHVPRPSKASSDSAVYL